MSFLTASCQKYVYFPLCPIICNGLPLQTHSADCLLCNRCARGQHRAAQVPCWRDRRSHDNLAGGTAVATAASAATRTCQTHGNQVRYPHHVGGLVGLGDEAPLVASQSLC